MKRRLPSFALLFALISALVLVPAGSVAARPSPPNPLKNVRAQGRFGEATVTVTGFSLNAAGKLVARGTVTSPTRGHLSTFNNVQVRIEPTATCEILNLVISPIDLTLLGLRVQTSTITLVITGDDTQLLGSLLCLIANLLNGDQSALVVVLNRVLVLLGGGLPAGTILSGLLPLNFVNFFERDGQVFGNFVIRTADGTFLGPFATEVELLAVEPGTCTILNLVLGPVDLNILGLRVQLYGATPTDPVTVTITGETGPGNLLGNLLCGIVGLLGDLGLTPVQRSNRIIVILNRILAALG